MNMHYDRGIFDKIPTTARPFWVSDVNVTPLRSAPPMHDKARGKSSGFGAFLRAITGG